MLLVVYPLILGLLVGSYLNVVIYRLPRGLSTVRPPSACPGCEKRIRAFDNVPVLSFLALRGKCRHCGQAIGWRYPFIESLTAGLFVACVQAVRPHLGGPHRGRLQLPPLDSGRHRPRSSDPARSTHPPGHRRRSLHRRDRLSLAAHGRLSLPLWQRADLLDSLIGAALGAGVILGINGLWWVLRRVQGFGLGDAKMLAMVGAFLGPQGIAVTLFFATLGGSVVGLYLIARKRIGLKGKLPFGSFLALGAVIALFFGPALLDWYLGLYR